ncbi:hypothetical protein Q5692_37775 [Microcoleus sp. C2C3]|uniref:hypothetical protein n=1 Tax=unclassified Microcoleus TaxID=2642155 RepID=UPI002FCFC6C9
MTYSTSIAVQFYPFTPSMAKKLREAGLSAAEWRFWSYLTEQDPWGDNYKELDPLDIMRECGMSKATYYRAKAKFQELGLFDFQESKACVRNLEGISKMRREAQKSESSLKNETALLKNDTAKLEMRTNPQKTEKKSLRPLPSKDSATLQTYSNFNQTNQTLSEATRERNLYFWNDFDERTRSQLKYYAYQVALPKLPIKPTLPDAWISCHCEELFNQMMYDVQFQRKWEKLFANSPTVENQEDTSEAEPHDTIDW